MNQLEQFFREQCAQICDKLADDTEFNMADVCADQIRALPLPEVTQEHVAEVVNKYGDPEAFAERELKISDKVLQQIPIGTKLYTLTQDAEALRKENKELLKLLASSRDCIDHHLLIDRAGRRDSDYDLIAQIDAALKGGAA